MNDPLVIGDATLWLGDCLDILPCLKAASFDLVLADPPYIIGATSVGNPRAKCGSFEDVSNSARWYASWIAECVRVLRPTGHLAVFGNWRSLPTLLLAFSRVDLTASSCVVWDKDWIGPSGPHQLRPTWELVLHAAMPDARVDDRAASDVIRCKWMAANCADGHPAQKPVALLRRLIGLLSPPRGQVLDPFAGSASVAEAALLEGRPCVSIEMAERYHAVGVERISALCGKPIDGLFAAVR